MDELNKPQKQRIITRLQEYIVIKREAELLEPSKLMAGKVLDVIEFSFNSYFLESNQVEQIKKLATNINELDDYYIELVGHCDSKGNLDINKEISLKRARAVLKQLQLNNIDEDNIIYYGKASYEPFSTNDSELGRSKNRRVEIIIHTNEELNQNVSFNPE
jgi:outer membrane protein OmpA-like peptidoglycan-associated protein